jgi:hypothetical protein
MSRTVYERLMLEKCPPTNEREKIYASIVLAIAEDVDKLKTQTAETIKALRVLAKIIREMGGGAQPAEEAAQAADVSESPIKDQTPFPSNLKAGAGVAGSTGPLPDETPATPAPSAVPVEVVNKKASAKNGSKDAAQS